MDKLLLKLAQNKYYLYALAIIGALSISFMVFPNHYSLDYVISSSNLQLIGLITYVLLLIILWRLVYITSKNT